MNTDNFEDFTDRPCRLDAKPEPYGKYCANDMPMYSYDRPAYMYWNGVANYLRSKGCADKTIAETLAHKHMRWMLDKYDDDLQMLGYTAAKAYFQDSKPNNE